jgi:hypothetical protein
LCPQFDQDLFAFDVTAPGTIVQLTLSMDTAQTRVNPAYRIVRDNGTAEGAPTPFAGEDPQKSQGEPTNFTAAHRLQDAGRYYVLVADARFVDDTFDVVNPYTLSIALVADPDAAEPNGDPATATVVASGTTAGGQLATAGDEDWFALDIPAGAQILDVVIDANADSGVDVVATLVAADGQTELLGAPLAPPSPATGRVGARLRGRVPGGQRAYVVLKDDDGADSQLDAALGGYTVTFTVVGNPDGNEGEAGNDDPATATQVASGTTLQATLATTADQDLYRIDGGDATREAPKVLVVELSWQGPLDAPPLQPQVTVFGVDPEVDNRACVAGCGFCDESQCKSARLQRFVDKSEFRTAYPLREGSDALVLVNDVGDDAFQDGVGYTIRFTVLDDTDPGERGDDLLLPNLEFAGFANGGDLDRQLDAGRRRARVLTTGFPGVCAQDQDPAVDQCLALVPVPDPVPGIDEDATEVIDCSDPDAAPVQLTATGRLTYEGDRDYFRFDLPPRSYFALDFDYALTGGSTTPLELALFVYNPRGDRPIANTLEATQTQGRCQATVDCPAGSICVDGACWSESDANPTFASRAFPVGDDCAFVSPFDSAFEATAVQPFLLEVVDNGINDFDTDATYRITLDVRCGCPASCNPGTPANNRCQGVPDPR